VKFNSQALDSGSHALQNVFHPGFVVLYAERQAIAMMSDEFLDQQNIFARHAGGNPFPVVAAIAVQSR
jgi:hypothetical protein